MQRDGHMHDAVLKAPVPVPSITEVLSSIEHSQYLDGWPLQTGEQYKGLAGAAFSPVLYRIVRNWSNVYPSWGTG
jgi:hypothetical protein